MITSGQLRDIRSLQESLKLSDAQLLYHARMIPGFSDLQGIDGLSEWAGERLIRKLDDMTISGGAK